ncbi:MAG TPA: HD domain-containing phosphohydrolase [Anaerolineales bacterium]
MANLLPFLTSVIGLRDPHGKGHANHVKDLSFDLGQNLGLSSAQIETLVFAAEIHDIGKIAINEFIINKPGRFTEAEYLMVQHHAQLGASLIKTLNLNPLIPLIVLHHHENFDGSGYPDRLTGDQIPLESRIIRITDTYDALTSNRGYRAAYSPKKALKIMEQEHHPFDRQLLEIFLRMQGGKKH